VTVRVAFAVTVLVIGCGDGAVDSDAGADGADAAVMCDADLDYIGAIDLGADPCEDVQYWPHEVRSASYPLIVHFASCSELDTAVELLGYLETSWQVEVDELGFSPPLPDDGQCGPDGDYDVFVWRDLVEGYVAALAENDATDHDDYLTYMALDPWGPYGGDILSVTAAHELNHAMQATDDWWEPAPFFEMSAVFIEDVVYPEVDDYVTVAGDFQSRPDWSLDRDDGYETWYMYSAGLYLHMLRDRYFDGRASFVADAWRESRSPAVGPNEPDFISSLDGVLESGAGVSFDDSVVELARWRWYTGSRHDSDHFRDGVDIPEVALAADVTSGAHVLGIEPAPMMLGNGYIRVTRGNGPASLDVSLMSNATGVRWVVQAVPSADGSADGEILDVSSGSATLDLSTVSERALVVTALPIGEYDTDARNDDRYPVVISLTPN
jgi:hypothetical protein